MDLQEIADPSHPESRPLEAIHESLRETDVVEPQALEGVQAEDVPCDAAQYVRHVPGLEELHGVRYPALVPLDLEDRRMEPLDVGLHRRQLGPGADRALGGDAPRRLLKGQPLGLETEVTD